MVYTLDPIESGKGDHMYWLYGVIVILVLYFLFGIRIVRPTGRGLVERLGKYHHLAQPGFNWIIPVIDRMFLINITE
ncbi:SPFH domain-containing protein, partial [Thermodesulfobacteriota bacterium]